MKLDEKWRQLVAESHAARKVLDEALAPVLKKLTAIGAGTSRENSTPEEDARLQAASEVLDVIHVRMKEFIAENTGRR
jgi:Ser-tRNA(Ala) deacylase AlaX